jgi:hypothetical protein
LATIGELIVMRIILDDYNMESGMDTAIWTTSSILVQQHERLFEQNSRTQWP